MNYENELKEIITSGDTTGNIIKRLQTSRMNHKVQRTSAGVNKALDNLISSLIEYIDACQDIEKSLDDFEKSK